jgi:hypothetical protein
MDGIHLSEIERRFLIQAVMGMHHALLGEEVSDRVADHMAAMELIARILRANELDPRPASDLAEQLGRELSWSEDRRLRQAFEEWAAAVRVAKVKRRALAAEAFAQTRQEWLKLHPDQRPDIGELLPQE